MLQLSSSASRGIGSTMPAIVPHMTGGPPRRPLSAESIPPPMLATILANLSIDSAESETANPASRPYAPVTLQYYPHYGGQQIANVLCTDYARQAAELLIDNNGELDSSHISSMLRQLQYDTTLPPEHREHVMLTLAKLQKGGELAGTINSICQDKPLKGGAADVVRGTLNLPPEHELTKADARKAVVMSMLGYLRQSSVVGSCFGTAPAICLLGSSPEVVAKDMKELLEEQKLTFLQQNGTQIEAPLNQHVFHSPDPLIFAAREDGTFLQQQLDGSWSKHSLQDIPGMKAALNALGIPKDQQQAALAGALSRMGSASDQNTWLDIASVKAKFDASGIPEHEHQAYLDAALAEMGVTSLQDAGHYVDCKKIIEQIARDSAGTDDPDKRIADAFRAFNGREHVGLLQAWEYTLTTFAAMTTDHSLHYFPQQLSSSRPDLQSPAEKNATFVAGLAADPRFGQIKLEQVDRHLQNEFKQLYAQRYTYQYDLNISNSLQSDGVSGYGGVTLYEKVPADQPSEWKRIDTADAYQEAMVQLAKDAAGRALSHVDSMEGDSETKREALRLIADNVVEIIQDKTYIEHAVLAMNPDAAGAPFADANQYQKKPWQMPSGGVQTALAASYGSVPSHTQNFWVAVPQAPTGAPPPAKADDAVDFVRYICQGMARMTPALQKKAQESPDGFKIPISHGPHAFTLMPMAMKELWLEPAMAPDQWIDTRLKAPAHQWMNALRIAPPASEFMHMLGLSIQATPEQMQFMQSEITAKIHRPDGWTPNFGEPPYSYGDLHGKLSEFCRSQANGEELLAKLQTTMMGGYLSPHKIIGDTNWINAAGRPEYVGVMYNPFADKVEVQAMQADGVYRRPLGDFNTWFGESVTSAIFAPLGDRVKPLPDNP